MSVQPISVHASPTLSIIRDLPTFNPPKRVAEYSSHSLLWESIAGELRGDPFRLQNIDAYLDARMQARRITAEGFDRALFVEGLILPAFAVGIALAIRAAGVPLACHGDGWQDRGVDATIMPAIRSRGHLQEAAASSAALIHCWPTTHRHPIDAVGAPTVRTFGRSRDQFLNDARAALAGNSIPKFTQIQPLSFQLVMNFLAIPRAKAA